MKKNEVHHQIANELGIALGMVQLAIRNVDAGDIKGVRSYLERAESALGRLKTSTEALRQEHSKPVQP